MDKKYSCYMRLGKTVQLDATGEKYYLLSDCAEDGTVKAVSLKNKRRHSLLSAWTTNGVSAERGTLEEDRAEMIWYEKTLHIEDFSPANTVTFITPAGLPNIKVPDLGYVKINEDSFQVNWIDKTHFELVALPAAFGCFHIDQFAELAEQLHWKIKEIG